MGGCLKEVELKKKLASEIKDLAKPIDFDKLIEGGILVKKGRSFYIQNMNLVPDNVRKRIQSSG